MAAYRYSAAEWQTLLPWAEVQIPVPEAPDLLLERASERVRVADRIRGMMLGLAIGDALGNTSEGMTPGHRRHVHGEIRDYLPNPRADMDKVGLPSPLLPVPQWGRCTAKARCRSAGVRVYLVEPANMTTDTSRNSSIRR